MHHMGEQQLTCGEPGVAVRELVPQRLRTGLPERVDDPFEDRPMGAQTAGLVTLQQPGGVFADLAGVAAEPALGEPALAAHS